MIGRLDAAEVERLAGICQDLFEAPWTAVATASTLSEPGNFALLADSVGEAAGLVLARLATDECEILWLRTRPAWHRKGVGRGLLRAALDEGKRRGAKTAYLEVAETNAAGLALYRTEGFSYYGRRRAYYPNGRAKRASDALLLKKMLDSIDTCRTHSRVEPMRNIDIQAK